MLNQHSAVGIAIIVFYAPAVVLAKYLLLVRHGRPRQAWILLLTFSLVRVASGIIAIIYEKHTDSVGLLIATIILLGTGVMPLIAMMIGFLRLILSLDLKNTSAPRKIVISLRILFIISVVLLVVGGNYVGNYESPTSVDLGAKLVKAGYTSVVITLAYIFAFEIYLWTRRQQLCPNSLIVLQGLLLSTVFLTIRITYAMLSIFNPSDLRWNDLSGSVAVFVVMDLLMEYLAMVTFIGVGFMITPILGPKKNAIQAGDRQERLTGDVSGPNQKGPKVVNRLYQLWNERD